MQWELWAKFMTYEELEIAYKVFGDVLRSQARQRVKQMARPDKEERIAIIAGRYFEAIGLYKRRNQCSAVLAKAAIDLCREKMGERVAK